MKPIRAWARERRVGHWVRKAQEAVVKFGYRAFPQLAASALAMEAEALSSPGIPPLFARDLREISPTLNEDLLDLYGRSEQALANQFAFLNHSEALGPQFDWEFHESPAWRRELHAFDFALDLAMTYRISQEERYALHLRYLTAHWIAANPPGQSTGWEMEPLARRVRNWILAADLVRTAWEGDKEFLDLFSRSLALQCVFLKHRAARLPSPDIASHAARALLLAGGFFVGPSAAEFAETGQSILKQAEGAALRETGDDGFLRPSALLSVAEACVENLIISSSSDEAQRSSSVEAAHRVLSALEGALMPDGTLPLFGPSARTCPDEVSDLFAVAAAMLNEPGWKKLAGKFGIAPYLLLGERGKNCFEQMSGQDWLARTRAVPEAGLYRLSSGHRSALMINARSVLPSEDHNDFLSYELSLEGSRVVVDSGDYSPTGETWDKYFASARAHNVLLLDGHALRPSGAKHGHAPASDWIVGEGCRGIGFQGESPARRRILRHRAFYAVGENAWAILDRLEGAGSHQIQNLIHFYPTFAIQVCEDRAVVRSRAVELTIFPLGPAGPAGMSAFAWKASRGHHSDFPGYFSPDVGVKFQADVLALEANEVQFPWLGGYLIVAGAQAGFRVCGADPVAGSIEFELAGKRYRLIAR